MGLKRSQPMKVVGWHDYPKILKVQEKEYKNKGYKTEIKSGYIRGKGNTYILRVGK